MSMYINHTQGNWKVGKLPSVVITDEPLLFNVATGHDAIDYYGGYLICESVLKPADARLISASPDLYYACKEMLQAVANDDKKAIIDALGLMQVAVDKAKGEKL